MQKSWVEIAKKVIARIWPALFLAVVTFGTFFTTLVLNRRTFYAFIDNIEQAFPWYQKLAVAVHQGSLPLWDANTSAGHSLAGDLIAGIFYPINLAWVWLFGSVQGIDIFWLEFIIVFHFWLAATGMYLVARSLGLSKIGSIVSGMIFAFMGALAMRSVAQTVIFMGLALIPWAFYAFNRWLSTKSFWALFGCAATLALIILAGHIQPLFHAIMLITLYVLLRRPDSRLGVWLKAIGRRLVGIAAAVAISLFLALPQLLLAAQYLPDAVRFVGDPHPISTGGVVSFETYTKTFAYPLSATFSLIDPSLFPAIDSNELYIGLIGLGVLVGAVVLFRRAFKEHRTWRLHGWFLVGTSLLALVIMIGYWTFIPALLRELPLISQIRQLGRYSILVHFCLAILVGVAVEIWAKEVMKLKKAHKKRYLLALGAAAFLFVNGVYLWLVVGKVGTSKHLAIQALILAIGVGGALLLVRYTKWVLLVAVTLSVIVTPLWFMPRVTDFQQTYPPNYFKRSAVVAFLEGYSGKARILVEDQALPINLGDVYDIQTINGYGATLYDSFYRYINQPDAEGEEGRRLDFMNIRFIVAKTDRPNHKLVLDDAETGIRIYERPTWAPRAYLKSERTQCIARSEECHEPAITQYGQNEITVEYDAAKADQLVLSEVNAPGWKATIDGQKVDVQSDDPTGIPIFRMVDAPAGRHVVRFWYDPYSL